MPCVDALDPADQHFGVLAFDVHARAVDVEVAHRDIVQAVHVVVRAQQALEHDLRSAVPGAVVVGVVIFGRREGVGEAEDRGGGGGEHLLHAGLVGGVDDVERAVVHHFHGFARIGGAGGDADGGHVDDRVHAFGDLVDQVLVADVALDELDALVLERVLEVAGRAAGHVVQDHDLGRLLVREQLVDRGGADEACAPRHQDFRTFDLHRPITRNLLASCCVQASRVRRFSGGPFIH